MNQYYSGPPGLDILKNYNDVYAYTWPALSFADFNPFKSIMLAMKNLGLGLLSIPFGVNDNYTEAEKNAWVSGKILACMLALR